MWYLRRLSAGEWTFILVVILLLLCYSWSTLTTRPKLSFDEGFVIEEASNFAQYGVLDTVVAPSTFSGVPHIASSIGFSYTLPLALLFKLFGFGIALARGYALAWMLACVFVAYILARRFFGVASAVQTALLMATLPPFHQAARSVMGDVAGFTYLLAALYVRERSSFWAGVLLGLCLVARPSMYALALCALVVQMFWSDRLRACVPLIRMGLGASISVILSLLLYSPASLTKVFWVKTMLFIKNPSFGTATPAENVISNIKSFPHESTLIYFLLLGAAIAIGALARSERRWNRDFAAFSLLFCSLIFCYFLRSPGWFKYLLPLQLLVFFFLPSALENIASRALPYFPAIFNKLRPQIYARAAVAALVCIQLIQLLFFASIFSGTDALDTASFVAQRQSALPDSTVAFIHAPQIAMFFPADHKYSYFVVNEELGVGDNPLSFATEKRATLVVAPAEGLPSFSPTQFDAAHLQVLSSDYTLLKRIGNFNVYELKRLNP